MYCEPEVVEPPSLTVKTNLPALGRSTVCRHRTVRDSNRSRDRALVDRYSRESDRRSFSNSRGHGDSYLDSSRRTTADPVNVETGVSFARRAALTDLVSPVASQRVGSGQGRRLRTDVAILRDALHHERPIRRLEGLDTVPELLASPHPASFVAGRRARVRSELRHQNATSNMRASSSGVLGQPDPHPGADHFPVAPSLRRSTNASSLYPLLGPVPTGSLTSRFAPAHRFDFMEDISLREFLRQGYGMNREVSPDRLYSVVRGEPRTTLIPWQENQETPRYSLEGIEDRRHSLSPGHYSHRNLLDPMMPDDRLPGLTSSFTSVRVSASSLSSNPASYLGTITTAPSMSSLLHVHPAVCESTDFEGSITAEDNEYNDQNSYTMNYRIQTPTNGPYLNSRPSRLQLNAAELAGHSMVSEPGQEILQIQNIPDRLERNVPLEW